MGHDRIQFFDRPISPVMSRSDPRDSQQALPDQLSYGTKKQDGFVEKRLKLSHRTGRLSGHERSF
jgi:hypothetical protein